MEQAIALVFVLVALLVVLAAVGFVVLLVWILFNFLRDAWEETKAS